MRGSTNIALVVAIVSAALVTLGWGLNWYLLHGVGGSDRGTFGDMFGASNALYSGLALVGIIYAIFVQRAEIAIAKQELKYTKTILDGQREQLEKQNDAIAIQSFENTFFRLLELFADLTNNLDLERSTLSRSDNPIRGKDVFAQFVRDIDNEKSSLLVDPDSPPTPHEIYDRVYSKRSSELGHYFRTMYNIVKFIDASNIVEKKFYTNILRAQLSDSELVLLMYNGISSRGKKFKPYIERYELLDNLPWDKVLRAELAGAYDFSAFGPVQKIQ